MCPFSPSVLREGSTLKMGEMIRVPECAILRTYHSIRLGAEEARFASCHLQEFLRTSSPKG